MNITAIILAKNEEKNIVSALKSVQFCDEILVIDDQSTDKTVAYAKECGAQVITRPMNGNFSDQRNFAMTKSKNDWILFLDADEEVSPELKDELSVFSTQKVLEQSFYIKRRDIWWGKELKFGEILKARNKGIIRLVKKQGGSWNGSVHEEFISTGKTGSFKGYLIHKPHQSLTEFINDINIYSTRRAMELKVNGKTGKIGEILFYPAAKFILTYFLYLGILDGPQGFTYAFLMSFHSFLVRSKLYQYTKLD